MFGGIDAVDSDEEIGTITCWESNEPAKAKTKGWEQVRSMTGAHVRNALNKKNTMKIAKAKLCTDER